MPKKIDDEKLKNDIVADYNEGYNRSDLHRKYNISRDVINRILNENSVNQDFKRISPKTIEKIIEIAPTKTSIAKIKHELQIDGKTIKKVLKFYGVKLKLKETKHKKRNVSSIEKLNNYSEKYILSLLEVSMNHTTKILGVSDYTIKKYLCLKNLTYTKKYCYASEVDAEQKRKIIEFYQLGIYTQLELSKIFSLSRRTIKIICQDIDITNSKIIDKDKIEEFRNYAKLVRRLTTVTKNHYQLKPKKGFHYDHQISLVDGFNWGIPAGLLSSRENLILLSAKENLKKGVCSSINKEELYASLGI